MFSGKQIRCYVLAALLMLTSGLWAQRTVGRDHHVFHRPPPQQHHVSQGATVAHNHVPATPASTQANRATHIAPPSVHTPQ